RPGRARAAGDEVPRGWRDRGGAAMSARDKRDAGAVGALLDRVRGRGRKPGARRGVGYNATRRVALVGGVLALCGVALVARALHVQVLDNEFYLRQGDARALRELPIATSRGMITDRNGEPLAVSTPVESLWANPRELLQHTDRIGELASALSV